MSNIEQFLETAEASLYISMSELKKHNIQVNGKRTSVTLEPQVWTILHDIAEESNCTIHELCSFIQERKNPDSSLASAIRVFLISYLHIRLRRES